MKAESLHIQMTENTVTHIDITFCASLTEHLPRLLPPQVRARLRRRAIDPDAIAGRAAADGFSPGELFCVAEGPRTLRAWLE
jgi:hypothetical protein